MILNPRSCPAEKGFSCIVLQMHFPAAKCTFLQRNAVFREQNGRKPQEIAEGFQGSRIKRDGAKIRSVSQIFALLSHIFSQELLIHHVGIFPFLPFLAFLEFLVFFPCEEFLVFSSVFPFFSKDFRGSVGINESLFFGWFSLPVSKKRKGRTGLVHRDGAIPCDLRLRSAIPRQFSPAIPRKGFWF